jgi:serine/threonine protein kinase
MTRFEVRDGQVFAVKSGSPPILLRPAGVVRVHQTIIGRGANGEVFHVVDTLGRSLALKVWYHPAVAKRFDRARSETSQLANLGIHPLLVVVHTFGTVEGYPYALMELVKGKSVKRWLVEDSPAFLQKYAVWRMFSRALHVIYDQHIFHGDPHTGNILIFKDHNDLCRPFRRDAEALQRIKSNLLERLKKAKEEIESRRGETSILSKSDEYYEDEYYLRQYERYKNQKLDVDMRIGLKITDFGASRSSGSVRDLKKREKAVLIETAGRLFGHTWVRAYWPDWDEEPKEVLRSLDYFVETLKWFDVDRETDILKGTGLNDEQIRREVIKMLKNADGGKLLGDDPAQ